MVIQMGHNLIQNLNILSLNCQSIRNKIIEIQSHMNAENIDIAIFSETWLSNNHKLYFHNYTTYRKDRSIGEHGGVGLSIKNTIKHTELPHINTKVIETIGIKITTPTNEDIVIISCYFPGSNNAETLELFKKDIILLTSLSNNSYFLIGDFNAKHRLWNNTRANRAGQILYSVMSRRQFVIHNSPTPTFFPPQARSTHPSTIDICITNNYHSISQITSQSVLSSDHNPIVFTIYCNSTSQVTKTVFRFDKADWKNYQRYISNNINLSLEISTISQIESEIQDTTDILTNAKNLYIPKMKPKTNSIMLPNSIKTKITERNIIRRQWQRSRCPNTRNLLNALNREIRDDCINFRNKSFNTDLIKLENSSKKFWQVTKAIKNKNSIMPPLRNTSINQLVTTNSEKSELIASSFAKSHFITHNWISPQLENSVMQTISSLNSLQINPLDINKFYTKPSIIKQTIKNLKNKKSPGQDNINNIMLKKSPKKLFVKLTKIFNACIHFGHFPAAWKIAKVIALPKPGKDNSLPTNYRPISLLSSLSKILERILLNGLIMHMELFNILPDFQFGFRRGHATVHQLSRVIGDLKDAQNLKKSTGLIALDIEKAFDSVWHNGLIHKMQTLNFPVTIIKIIFSFLRNRSFFVQISEASSSNYNIVAGLPQGSCLSPILYNIYTSDFPTCNTVKVALFADDTALYCSNIDPNYIIMKLENELINILNYFKKWKIKINETKSQAIFLTKRRAQRYLPDRQIKFGNNEIDWKSELKYLGLIIDKQITFKNHCLYSNERAQKYIRILYPFINRKSKLNIHNKKLIFKCIFRPMLLYAGEVWGDCAETHTKSIQTTQNKILKLIYNLPFYYSTHRLHILSNTQLINQSLSLMKHKFIHKCQFSDNTLIQMLHN